MVDRIPLKDRARGHWKHVLAIVAGIDSRVLDGKHHPCPICGGKDRWRFDDLKGEGTSICGQCGSRSGVQLVMDKLGVDFPEAARRIEAIIGNDARSPEHVDSAEADDAAKYREALAYWRAGQRLAAGDPLDRYLARRVGRIEPPMSVRLIPQTSFSGKTMPAMVSAYVDAANEIAGIQRTFLTDDGRKYPGLESARWNTGKLPDGGAVRLAKLRPTDTAMGIAEGVETALSAMKLFQVPCWATLNSGRLRVWQPPEGVTEIIVFGDADMNYDGQSAAYDLAHRLEIKRKCKVQVMIPDRLGDDWNDVLQSKAKEAA